MKYKIGHGAYSGANAPFECNNAHLAVMELIRRGVGPKVARTKVNEAGTYPYPHVTMTTKSAVIEIQSTLS